MDIIEKLAALSDTLTENFHDLRPDGSFTDEEVLDEAQIIGTIDQLVRLIDTPENRETFIATFNTIDEE